ncbi:hypothetical protein JCM15457_848 [Liquorilactobacillus sucicola DSM 21376 = JCM 15457]|nr:hypothetical protein JCM15457_848 [Liquorilactobacillus sucicola DSM 21376 = JCM 15457]
MKHVYMNQKEEISENQRTIFTNLFYFEGLMAQPPLFCPSHLNSIGLVSDNEGQK